MNKVVVDEIKFINESVYQEFKKNMCKTEDYLNQYEINILNHYEEN